MALPCCTICLDAFDEAKEVSVLDCGHAYHYPCILDWSLQSKGPARCPSCKKTINWYPANGVVSKVFFHQSLDKGKDAALIEELKKQLQEQKDQILKGEYCIPLFQQQLIFFERCVSWYKRGCAGMLFLRNIYPMMVTVENTNYEYWRSGHMFTFLSLYRNDIEN